MEDLPLQALLERVRSGSHDAFRVLFDRLNDRLFAHAYAHTKERESAKDLVQETFIDLWRGVESFSYRSDQEFHGFVFLILKRKLTKYYSERKRAPGSLDQRMEEVGDRDETLAIVPEYEYHRGLMKGFDQLSETSREILSLRNWSDLSFKEIAHVLDISESAAKVRHHRAIGELRDTLIAQGYDRTDNPTAKRI